MITKLFFNLIMIQSIKVFMHINFTKNKFRIIDLSNYSPDINPIENILKRIKIWPKKKKIYKLGNYNKKKFKKKLQKKYQKNLAVSMKKRIEVCIDIKDGVTNY